MIQVEQLSKSFKSYKKGKGLGGTFKSLFSKEYEWVHAVDDISFTIPQGDMVGYIGANGAGKSTTIKMMTGILVPTGGHCTVNGIVPYEQRQQNAKQIGVVFGQRTQLWWDLPLNETYSILREIYEVTPEAYKERMAFLNKLLDLDEIMGKTVRTLSLGQRMRADLAASMIHNPKVLYLDEPTIGLDIVVKERMREGIKYINETYGTTVILTTHDMSDIEELCNRVMIIDKGKMLYDGDLEQIKNRFGNYRTAVIEYKGDISQVAGELNAHFAMDEEALRTKVDDYQLNITFDKNLLSLADLMAYVLPRIKVTDFTVTETAVEDVVKKIYRKEVQV